MKHLLIVTALLVQPLAAREFHAFDNGLTDLKTPAEQAALLAKLGYNGPVTLQCYQIKQPAEVHLAQSMQAWRQLTAKR